MSDISGAQSNSQRSSVTIGSLRIERIPELIATGILLVITGISPLMFVAQGAGVNTMNFWAIRVLIPAIVVAILIAVFAGIYHWDRISHALAVAVIAGPLAGVGLEVVRIIGFRVFHAMPGSMPMLMGVMITNRSNLGPDIWSNIVGWADHVVINGISFALFYVLVFGKPRWYMALPYLWVVGTLFMLSPDMTMMGDIGIFGHAMGPRFAITVYVAHTVFGLILGSIVAVWGRIQGPLWRRHFTTSSST